MAKHGHSEPLHIDTQEGSPFNVGSRFTELRAIGYGANGLVFAAVDRDCDKKVAIKKISFHNQNSCKYALREVKIMRRLDHENVVSVYDVLGEGGRPLVSGRTADLRAVYIIQELLDTDLNQLIQRKQLQPQHTQWFLYQLLRAMKYIHSANVLHRDVKPSNLLINCEDLTLKIADFGLARVLDPSYNHGGYLTENVGTYWYKSPEVILSPSSYTKATDMWSIGCIFAEMLTGTALFPGVSDLDQLHLILDTVEMSDSDWTHVTQLVSNKVLKNHALQTTTPLADKIGAVDSQALDLLSKLLVFNPSHRWTAEEALAHPYLSALSLYADEPQAAFPLQIEHEVDDLSPSVLKGMILSESMQASETCGREIDRLWLTSGNRNCRQEDRPPADPSVVKPSTPVPSVGEQRLENEASPTSFKGSTESLKLQRCHSKSPEELKSLTDSQNELEKLNDANSRNIYSSSESIADCQNELNKSYFKKNARMMKSSDESSGEEKSASKEDLMKLPEDCGYIDRITSKKITVEVDNVEIPINSPCVIKEEKFNKKECMVKSKEYVTKDKMVEKRKAEDDQIKWKKAAKESFKLHGLDLSEKDEADMSPRKLEEDLEVAQGAWDFNPNSGWAKYKRSKNCSVIDVLDSGQTAPHIDQYDSDTREATPLHISEEVMKLNQKNKDVDLDMSNELDSKCKIQDSQAGIPSCGKSAYSVTGDMENLKEHSSLSPKSMSPSCESQTHLISGFTAFHPGMRVDKNAKNSVYKLRRSPSSDGSDCDNSMWEKWEEKEKDVAEDEEATGAAEVGGAASGIVDNDVVLSVFHTRRSDFDIKRRKTAVNQQSHYVRVPGQGPRRKNRPTNPPKVQTESNMYSDFDERYRLPTAHLTHDRHRTNQRLKAMMIDQHNEDRHLAEIRMHEIINERLKWEEQGDEACGGANYLSPEGEHWSQRSAYRYHQQGPPLSPDSPHNRRLPTSVSQDVTPLQGPRVLQADCDNFDLDALNSRSPSHGAKPKGYKKSNKISPK